MKLLSAIAAVEEYWRCGTVNMSNSTPNVSVAGEWIHTQVRLGVIVTGNSNSNSKDYRKQCNSNIIDILEKKNNSNSNSSM